MIYTLKVRKPNEITAFDSDGIYVRTEKSSPGSELVTKKMFENAIYYLIEHKDLSNKTLLNELNVKRSSFVMAALSKLDYVGYETDSLKIYLKT
ncbi:hypothetical protein ACFL6W_04760 [Thermodesulfobacteriota bacterium]